MPWKEDAAMIEPLTEREWAWVPLYVRRYCGVHMLPSRVRELTMTPAQRFSACYVEPGK
jgi:hypothetical protein